MRMGLHVFRLLKGIAYPKLEEQYSETLSGKQDDSEPEFRSLIHERFFAARRQTKLARLRR